MDIKLGADPELFVKQNGVFRCADGLIKGTKEEPFKVDRGAVQVDGFALEYNIDPATTEDEWVLNHTTVLKQLKDMVPKHDFAIVPTARFNGNHFRAQRDEAKELGCEPDYNAYTLCMNPRPDNNTTMRTAAGHVHVGFCEGADINDPAHIQRCATLVKQLDYYLGLPSLSWDEDINRRQMYGRAGAMRVKTYGVEYRVLSNAWLVNEERMRFVFRKTKEAVSQLLAGNRPFNSGVSAKYSINRSLRWQSEQYIKDGMVAGITIEEVLKCL